MQMYPELKEWRVFEGRLQVLVSWVTIAAMGSYFVFYTLAPWAYDVGPAILLLMALVALVFGWPRLRANLDGESQLMIATFLGYFLLQVSVLTMHGEDLSEFDLSTRYLGAAIVLASLLMVPVRAKPFFFAVGVGGAVTGGLALYWWGLEGPGRLQSFDNPIHYGNGALALSCLSLAGLSWASRQRYRALWSALFLCGLTGGLVASFLSGTRSGWVAIPLLVPVILFAYRDRILDKKWLIPVILAAVGLLVIAMVTVDVVRERSIIAAQQVEQYFEDGANYTSVGLRLDMYKAGLAAFSENPLVGIGPSGMEGKVDAMARAGEIHQNVAHYRHLHNQYIDNMARYGLVGLLSYLALLLVPFFLFLSKARHGLSSVRAIGLAGALFVVLHGVVNLTQSMLERNIGVMMYLFVLVFVWAVLKAEEREDQAASDAPVV
ncbi:O-antigen ligase family protein [Marinobacter daepoensis]|uniref:O-antigen ligase family protein n=1 Tax=Marinobacter daepoensis TaxID=262077 RepID=A0ABS3BFP8_9GAMM|nr:O-antigen ligase family protein [Marinobacter daepoensis]MBN7770582.1 O-antigen ligase family protein [Marinobacter daepoensis]MBY6080524.1 O-antigen ligase family protein [Marinobacter daepoensis]